MIAEKTDYESPNENIAGINTPKDPEIDHYAVATYDEATETGSIDYWAENGDEEIVDQDFELNDLDRTDFLGEFNDFVYELRRMYQEAKVTDMVIVD